jgi:polyferredoxin
MDKMNYPRGLIRNSTQNGLEKKLARAAMFRRVLRPRILIYTSVLVLVSAGLLWSLLSRASFRVDVVRDRGSIGRTVGPGQIENVYRLQIMNATEHEQRYLLAVEGIAGAKIVSDAEVMLDGASSRWVPVRVQVPPDAAGPGSHPINFSINAQGLAPEKVVEKSVFLVPR